MNAWIAILLVLVGAVLMVLGMTAGGLGWVFGVGLVLAATAVILGLRGTRTTNPPTA